MIAKERKPTKESWAELTGMDRLDLAIIVLAVVVSTLVKHQRWFDGTVPNWVLDFVLPFLLILAAYKVRGWQRARKERLAPAKRWPPAVEETSSFRDEE